MYRINLYPEYQERRRRTRIRLVRTGLLSGLAGVVLISLSSLALSAFLVQARVDSISDVVDGQLATIQNQNAIEQELLSAREMLSLRSKRIDWAPKLTMLSEKIGEDLLLVGFEGKAERDRTKKSLKIIGESRDEGVQMQVFTNFVDTLRIDPRITMDFPNLRLGSVGGGQGTQFEIRGDDQEDGT